MKEQLHHKTQDNTQYAAAQRKATVKDHSGLFLEDNRESSASAANLMGTKALQLQTKTSTSVTSHSPIQGTIQFAKGKRQKEIKKAAKAAKAAADKKAKEERRADDADNYEVARAGKSRKVNRILKRRAIEAEERAYQESRQTYEVEGHEQTHRNLFTKHSRRNSIAEAQLLDTINPSGAATDGLNLADFRARFQPLVQGGNISNAQLTNLLPPGKAVDFPPARGRGKDEIRAGRKWSIPNPDGGNHEIWVHTNDPRHGEDVHSGSGPVVRVKDSSGKFLSDQALTAPQDLINQRDAAKGQRKDQLNAAVANKEGHWTTPDDDRADNQHIPLVDG